MSFSQQGSRALCVLSANGAVSTVTLVSPPLLVAQSHMTGNSRNRIGGLSVSLASLDGRVIGGGVGGMLIAAGPVQVILGSFIWGGSKTKNKKEAVEGVTDFDHQTMDNSVVFNSMLPDQNLTQSSPLAMWPSPPIPDPEVEEEEDEEDKYGRLWLYASTAIGFIVGFWVVFGSLVIKRSWRHAYFRFLDKIKDRLSFW